MTVDGYDLEDFVLNLQSDFTADIEARVLTLEASATALENDFAVQKTVENERYTELTGLIDEQKTNAETNRKSIDVNKALIDELYETTRVVGKFYITSKEAAGDLKDGEGGFKWYNPPLLSYDRQSFQNAEFLLLSYVDLLAIRTAELDETGATDPVERSYENIFPGDLIEISAQTSLSFMWRTVYQITNVELLSKAVKIQLFYVSSSGMIKDNFQDELDPGDTDSVRYESKIEIVPSMSLETFGKTSEYEKLLRETVPIGMIAAWPTTNAPVGWLLCDGRSVPEGTEYDELRAMKSSTPDLRGRTPVGVGALGVGTSIGAKIDQSTSAPKNGLTTKKAGQHNHTCTTSPAGEHTHKYGDNNKHGGGNSHNAFSAHSSSQSYVTSKEGGHNHTMTVGTVSDHTHQISGFDDYNRMYSVALQYIIKAYHIT